MRMAGFTAELSLREAGSNYRSVSVVEANAQLYTVPAGISCGRVLASSVRRPSPCAGQDPQLCAVLQAASDLLANRLRCLQLSRNCSSN